jgi:hypothetical protein
MGVGFRSRMKEASHLNGFFSNIFEITNNVLSFPKQVIQRIVGSPGARLTLCMLETYPMRDIPFSYRAVETDLNISHIGYTHLIISILEEQVLAS